MKYWGFHLHQPHNKSNWLYSPNYNQWDSIYKIKTININNLFKICSKHMEFWLWKNKKINMILK